MRLAAKAKLATFIGIIAVGALFMNGKFPINRPYVAMDEEPKHTLHLSVGFTSLDPDDPRITVKVLVNGAQKVHEKPDKSPWAKTIRVPQTSVVRLIAEQEQGLSVECYIFDNNGNILAERYVMMVDRIECIASLL